MRKKKILFFAAHFNRHWAHYYFYHDKDFIDALHERGYEFFLADASKKNIMLNDFDYFLFLESYSVFKHIRFLSWLKSIIMEIVGYSQKDLYSECIRAGLYRRMALAVFEVSSILPQNASKRLFKMFPTVFCTDDDLVNNENIFKFSYPQPKVWPKVKNIPFEKKKLLVSVLSNKNSSHPKELYSQRRQDFLIFSSRLSGDFDLFGNGWDESIFSSYRGEWGMQSYDLYPKYKFVLCYENASFAGNIDEKIFQCMRSGAVPIFLGARNVSDYIPKNAFIDRRDFCSAHDLCDYLEKIKYDEYLNFQEAINNFLVSDAFRKFTSPSFANTIVDGFERFNVL